MIYTRDSNLDKRRYNIACNKVAVVFVADNGDPPIERDVTVFLKDTDAFQTVNILSKHVDGMVYPLILPSGGFGWSPYLKSLNEDHKKNISTLQFYKYKLNVRDDFNPYLNLGKIVQQYIVDQWVKIEGSRLHYYKSHQATLRT